MIQVVNDEKGRVIEAMKTALAGLLIANKYGEKQQVLDKDGAFVLGVTAVLLGQLLEEIEGSAFKFEDAYIPGILDVAKEATMRQIDKMHADVEAELMAQLGAAKNKDDAAAFLVQMLGIE
jgi:hypothetical protein